MKKKLLLGAILALNGFLLGIKKDRDFNRDEIKHALDLMTDKNYMHDWSRWLSKNTENQVKCFIMFQNLKKTCNNGDNFLGCNIILEGLDDLIIKPLRRLDNGEEAKDLIATLEEKRNYHRVDL